MIGETFYNFNIVDFLRIWYEITDWIGFLKKTKERTSYI